MPLFTFFSSTIPPLTRSLSPFSRSRQQAKQSQRRPSPSPPPTRAPSPQHPAPSSSSSSPPPSRSRSRSPQTPTLHTSTPPPLPNNQPAPAPLSPPMTNTPLICPTCAATEVRELFNTQGHRRAAVCPACFSKFAKQEVEAREGGELTSFPRLMEVADEQVAMETEERPVTGGGSLGRVFSGLQLFGKRRDSVLSEGGE